MKDTTKAELNRLLYELHKAHYAGHNRRENAISRKLQAAQDRAKREEVRS
ncbi:hypothetical protein SAMN05920897_101327 [Alkalispirochaeta americana]|uniref:Uncharacterized protein n=1 Tax=Alkalispirochaeta americana TaxID=159291 RepID=A0A1N6NM80_9SPIO|nr:hypothetical protein [Alkalispirochaeta americana]SIP93194.1 hypothetical protein SAMN05920897_101327 [Alkalispirochaeta americana]